MCFEGIESEKIHKITLKLLLFMAYFYKVGVFLLVVVLP